MLGKTCNAPDMLGVDKQSVCVVHPPAIEVSDNQSEWSGLAPQDGQGPLKSSNSVVILDKELV